MENSNVNRLSFVASVSAKLSSLVMLVLQLYCALVFYNGIVLGIGFVEGVSMTEHVKSLITWLSTIFAGGASIFPEALNLMHLIIFVVAAVNFLISFIRFFFLFFGSEDKFIRNHKNSYIISKKFIVTSYLMLAFMLISSWAMGFNILKSAFLIVASACIGILVSRLSRCVMAKTPFMTFVFQIVYSVIFFAILGMIMIFFGDNVITVLKANVDELKALESVSLKVMINYVTEIVEYLVLAMIMFSVVVMVKSCAKSIVVPNKTIKKSGSFVLTLTIVYIVMNIINNKSFEMDVLKQYGVYLLIALALFFFGKIEPKLEKKKPEADNDDNADAAPEAEDTPDEAPADEPAPENNAEPAPEESKPEVNPEPEKPLGTLYIGRRVKKIKSKKHRNITDIDTIVIPAKVSYIEGYAFFGCNAVKEIRCERKEKPRFWHEAWNVGCPAKVIWDCNNVNSSEE